MSAAGEPGPVLLVEGLQVGSSHPALEGHFPGNPVVPGVVLLDEVLAVVRRHRPGFIVAELPAVKFLSPLRPDEPYSIRLEPAGPEIRFECFTAERRLALGSLRAADGISEAA